MKKLWLGALLLHNMGATPLWAQNPQMKLPETFQSKSEGDHPKGVSPSFNQDAPPPKFRPWVNISKDQGFSNQMIHYGITNKFNPNFREKYWTFDKGEIGQKNKSIPEYRPLPYRMDQPVEIRRTPPIKIDHIMKYYKDWDRRAFRPKLEPKISEKEKSAIFYNQSSKKYE